MQSCGRLIERRRQLLIRDVSDEKIFGIYLHYYHCMCAIVVVDVVVVVVGVVIFVAVMVVVFAVVVAVCLLCVASRLISNSPRFTSCLWVIFPSSTT